MSKYILDLQVEEKQSSIDLMDLFPDITDEDCYLEENHKLMTSVFFSISNQELCDKMSAEYGILMLNNDSILNSERYFDVVSETIEAGNKSLNNWKFLEKFQHSALHRHSKP